MIRVVIGPWSICFWWMSLLKPIKYGLPIDPERPNIIKEPGLFRIGLPLTVIVSDWRDKIAS